MGEVYRARDSRLKRDVALKTLADSVAADPDRLARFQREAEILASLNHPHIAAIYGLEEAQGTHALILELVEGETLAERIRQGALPVRDALAVGRQVAEALEAAHDHGVVHRDLKPANIKVTPDGVVKVLDFGLAKLADPLDARRRPDASASPTMTSPLATRAGVLLGTAAYMAPEQAGGRPVDKRADVWAFGCVLYETLTGVRAFGGEDVTETLGFILAKEPDWDRLPADTPSSIRRLLHRCLKKDRAERLRDAGDARLEIAEVMAAPAAEAPPPTPVGAAPPLSARRRLAAYGGGLALAGSLLGGALVWLVTRADRRDAPLPVNHVVIDVAPAERLRALPADDSTGYLSRTAIALSPDGRSLVFSGVRGDQQQLYVRPLDRPDAVALAGTDGGNSPFFSPDGQWVGFWAGGALKKVPLAGGPPVTIAQTESISGASWGADDRIVFAHQFSGLWRVAAAGGALEALTKLDPEKREQSHRLPQLLPGGEAVLFTVTRRTYPKWDLDDAQIVVQSLSGGTRRVLIEGGADAHFVPTGHLVYMRRGVLMAVRFDLARLHVVGGSRGALADVMQAANLWLRPLESGAGQISVSLDGTLAYLPGGPAPEQSLSLVWVDRMGRIEPLAVPPRWLAAPRLSGDGQRVAFFSFGYDRSIWLYDLARGSLTKLAGIGDVAWPVWAQDDARLVFLKDSAAGGGVNLFSMAADGSGTPARLTTSDLDQWPTSVSPDGQMLAFIQTSPRTTDFDVWTVPLTGKGQPRAVLDTPSNERQAAFAPDGRWLAYTSDESGRDEVWIQAFPDLGRKRQVSTSGGEGPAWRADGRELFFQSPGRTRMMAVPMETGLPVGVPEVLFEGNWVLTGSVARSYDVTPDGRRFLMVQRDNRPPIAARRILLVQNWFDELRRLVPAE
jgi:serine/threonine-protein kinase